MPKTESENNRRVKEKWSSFGVMVRWGVGLNKKLVAIFITPQLDTEIKIMVGDELRAWEGVGHVKGFIASDEIAFKLRSGRA